MLLQINLRNDTHQVRGMLHEFPAPDLRFIPATLKAETSTLFSQLAPSAHETPHKILIPRLPAYNIHQNYKHKRILPLPIPQQSTSLYKIDYKNQYRISFYFPISNNPFPSFVTHRHTPKRQFKKQPITKGPKKVAKSQYIIVLQAPRLPGLVPLFFVTKRHLSKGERRGFLPSFVLPSS